MSADHDEVPVDVLRTAVHDETVTAVQQTAHNAATATARRWLPWAVLLSLLIAILTSVTVGLAVQQFGGRLQAAESEVSELRRLAEAAKTAGDAANAQLAHRGEQPVPIPEPGTGEDSEVLVAAATARVLASLPDNSLDPAELRELLGEEVANYFTANLSRFTPTPQQIADSLAGYFTVNPPRAGPAGADGEDGADCDPTLIPDCRGPQGEKGEPGHPPTSEQIQAEFASYLRDNPDALCPLGGSYSQLTVLLADGGTADTWTCVVQVHPPTTTATTTPPPLLPPRR